MANRYNIQLFDNDPTSTNLGTLIITAGSQGASLVGVYCSATGSGTGYVTIDGVYDVVGGASLPPEQLDNSGPVALSTAVFDPTSYAISLGLRGGNWGFSCPSNSPVNLTPYPLVLAPDTSVMVQVQGTGTFMYFLNVFIEE